MDTLPPTSLLPIIQSSTTPVILISGMGLLLLTMTNRMGRIIDRTRLYASQLTSAAGKDREQVEVQLALTWERAKIVRFALTTATASMLMSATLVIVIFAGALFGREFSTLMLGLFVAALVLLVTALAAFLRDIFQSLAALRLEVEQARGDK